MIQYRPEIDGLRALAVLAVIFFHAGFKAFSGGYVGVDVFFVISGYLITSIILSQKQAGTFSWKNFYERRARRILPALFFVMFVSLVCSWYMLPPVDMQKLSQSLVAVSTFTSNVFFWINSGYFDGTSEYKPMLHTWSLAVEEQFYILFPVFFILIWRFAKDKMMLLIMIATLISFCLAQWGAIYKPGAAFYLLPTRAWEFLLGVLLALYLGSNNSKDHSRYAEFGSITGLLLIFCGVFILDEKTPFPGVYALIPTLGTVLIILFASSQTTVAKILNHRALVFIGLISYSAYLWHQPIFALMRFYDPPKPGDLIWLPLICVCLGLAYLS